MDALLQDLRYAFRQLAKSPGFTAVAVLTLALGVGVNTGVFSVANWMLLRPTPGIRDERQLATAYFPQGLSIPHYRSLLEQMPAFSAAAGQDRTSFAAELDRQAPRHLSAAVISPNYFTLLGASIGPGGTFTAEEVAAAGGSPVAIISHRLWTETYRSDPGIVGRTLRLNGVAVTVVGVAARGFEGTARPSVTDVWVPYPAMAVLSRPGPFTQVRTVPNFEDPEQFVFQEIVGRLAPGSTPVQAETQLRTAWQRLFPNQVAMAARSGAPLPSVRAGVGVVERVRDSFGSTVRVLAAASGVLLVLTTANLVNLLLFRAVRRRGEFTVRRALGASGPRLLRQSLAESLVLSLGGWVVALLVGIGLIGLFRGVTVQGLQLDTVPLDGRVLAFGLFLSVMTGIVVGLVPPILAGRIDLATALKNTQAKGSARRAYLRSAMTVVQLSACLSLMVGAFLLIGTLRNLQSVDLGFDAEKVSGFQADFGAVGYTPEQTSALIDEALVRLRRIPGVEYAAMAPQTPFGGGGAVTGVWTDDLPLDHRFVGRDAVGGVVVTTANVTADYFRVLGILVLRGRPFSQADMAAPASAERVAILGEGIARQLFGERDPVGLTFMNGRRPAGTPHRVIGVVRDSRWRTIVGEEMAGATSAMYRPLGDRSMFRSLRAEFLVRSRLVDAESKRAVQSAMADLAPSVPVVVEGMTERVNRLLAEQRLFARIIGALTALAVALAGLGLYGLVAFSVAERMKEFGIRVALGAQAQEVLNLVVRQGAVLAAIGVALGLAGSIALSRLIANRLFGVTPLEPYVYLGATAVLVLVVLIASVVPARAATRVDPMIALRSE